MKPCTKCGKKLPLNAFYKDRERKDGLQCWCKDCRKEYSKSEAGRAASRRHNKSKKRMMYLRQWRRSKKGQASTRASWYKRRAKYPERLKAKCAVNNAIMVGQLPRVNTLTCTDCGKPAEEYHHESYAECDWLNVEALCLKCHRKRHKERQRGKEIPSDNANHMCII